MYAEVEGNVVKLYGTIWEGNGPLVVNQISKLLAKANADVTIHLHTNGGSVIDGNLIFNAIAKSKANVTIIIDGLAASMGSVIMLAGKTIKMAENAFVMIHAPSGSMNGNAKAFENTAKVLRSMEDNFLKKMSARTGKDAEALKDWLDGDNWFSAQEALEEGLITEILDVIIEESSLAAYQDVKMCAQLFSSINQAPAEEQEETVIHKQLSKMKLNAKSLEILRLSDNASDDEINAAVEAQNQKIAAIEAAEKEAKKARIKKMLATAMAAGKFLAAELPAWEADAEANEELTERMLAKLPSKQGLSGKEVDQSDFNDDDKRTYSQWIKEDMKGLLEMKKNDPERYSKLRQSGHKFS